MQLSSCVQWYVKQWKMQSVSIHVSEAMVTGSPKSSVRLNVSLFCLDDLTERFKPPSLILQLLFFFSFAAFVQDNSFVSAAMMQKHSMNPFILQISPTKCVCVCVCVP